MQIDQTSKQGRRIIDNNFVDYKKRGDGGLSSKRKKRVHERHVSKRREMEGIMEQFGFNTGGVSCPSSLLHFCNGRAYHC
jgi:hypothetical protein